MSLIKKGITQLSDEQRKIPLGSEFLRLVWDQERKCKEDFDEWLPSAGIKAPKTLDALGTALSYLDRIASCWWGCREGTHIEERLVGKATSNARAALELLRSGYYDEALGMVRQIGETANLLCLFAQSPELHERWKIASEKESRTEFRPVKVRLRLEKLRLPLPMDEETYRLLSKQSVHVNPQTSPQSHNILGRPMLGGYFQEAGSLLTLNQLGSMVGWVLWLSVTLVKPSTDRSVFVEASVNLLRSIGAINMNTIENLFNEIRDSNRFKGTIA